MRAGEISVSRALYSHCPLKKRPVLFCMDSDTSGDGSTNVIAEPENLSTKPEDLRLTCKTQTSDKGDSFLSSKQPSVEERSSLSSPSARLFKDCQENSLEPFDNRVSPTAPSPSPWHRIAAPFYTPYMYSYSFPSEVYNQFYTSGITKEKISSPIAHRGNSHFFTLQQRLTSSTKPTETYHTNENSCFSPSSLSNSNSFYRVASSPPITPEELLSPRSVSSSGGSSTGSTGYGKKVKFQCPCCSKSYSTISGLTKHQQVHLVSSADVVEKKTFSCKSCDKVYVTSGALKMHIRTHTLPCKCVICGKAFSRPWLLQGHIRTHTGEKPFSCPLCERAFADRSNLRAHLQTHSEVKKYSCSSCRKTFSRMSLLTKHLDNGCPGPGLTFGDDDM